MPTIKEILARLTSSKMAVAEGDAHVRRALEALDGQDHRQAVTELEQAVQLGVRRFSLAEVYTVLGRAYKDLERYPDALDAHHKATDLAPTLPSAWNNLGLTYLEVGQAEQAEPCITRALSLDPNYVFAQLAMATLHLLHSRPEQAIELLEGVVTRQPEIAEAHGGLSAAYARVGRLEEAEQSLQRAIDLGYDNWQEIRQRITALQELSRPAAPVAERGLEDMVAALAGPTADEREAAARALLERAKQGLSAEEGLAALRAAAGEFPPRQYDFQDSAADLVRAAAQQPRPEYIPVVEELYAAYRPPVREAAMGLLARLPDHAAAVAYMKILRRFARQGEVTALRAGPLVAHPRHADVLLPKLLDYADIPALSFDVYLLCLTYLQRGLIPAQELRLYSGQVVDHYKAHEAVLSAAQQPEGVAWMWADDYQQSRNMGALLLDLMGYLFTPEVEKELVRALAYHDPRLKCFALCSLLRQGREVAAEHLLDVARSAEMRRPLYQELGRLDALSLFPGQFRTQPALAESDMALWLAYPTELGRVPDEIELMAVVGLDAGEKEGGQEAGQEAGQDAGQDAYLFRFRTHPPHWAAKDGWLTGWSGPFSRGDAPTAAPPGGTFSQFEPWEARPLDEHARHIREMLTQGQDTS